MDNKFYYYDINRRVYELNGVSKSSPFEEGHYIPIKVVSETDKEYVCEYGTINKKSMLYTTSRRPKVKVFTEQEKNDAVYVAENRHFISERVRQLPADVLRKVEEAINLENERFIELCKKHKNIMKTKNIIISVYANASGFLWSICKVDSGTDLGWCDFNGNCQESGAFKTYDDCLEDAITLIEKCDLDRFEKEVPKSSFHWGNYAEHLNKKYR